MIQKGYADSPQSPTAAPTRHAPTVTAKIRSCEDAKTHSARRWKLPVADSARTEVDGHEVADAFNGHVGGRIRSEDLGIVCVVSLTRKDRRDAAAPRALEGIEEPQLVV